VLLVPRLWVRVRAEELQAQVSALVRRDAEARRRRPGLSLKDG